MSKTRVSRTKPVVTFTGDRIPMPESTFLHIQGRGDSTVRMLELPLGPVRIGRGPHCEVRLGDPDLVEVQCMLRRRGNTWHFQPVGPPGHVWIDGRAADQQRPLPLGVPFRVGEHWLTLRPADSATNDWGSFEAPITVEPASPALETPALETPAREEPAPAPERPAASSTPVDNEERLRRWEARLDQRERWLKDRQEERRWEARWKSAGESIRTRSTPPASTPPTPRRTPPPPSPASAPVIPPRSPQTPPVARIIEPRKSEPLRRVTDPTPRPSAPRVVVRPLPVPPAPIRRPVETPAVRIAVPMGRASTKSAPEAKPEPVKDVASRALVTLPPTPVEAAEVPEIVPRTTIEPAPVDSVAPIPPVEVAPAGEQWTFEATSRAFEQPALDPGNELQTIAPVEVGPEPDASFVESPAPMVFEIEPDEIPADSVLIESETWIEELPSPVDEPSPIEEAAPPAPEIARPRWSESKIDDSRSGDGVSGAEWPSARAIFAAQGRRAQPVPEEVTRTKRRKAQSPEPTDALGPSRWEWPLWLGWLPVALVSTLVGLAGIFLAYNWAVESGNANVAMRLALRPDGAPGSPIDVTAIPRGGWWSSNATHLAAWAMALQRSGDGEDHSEDVRSLLSAARQASPLAARSRFVVEMPDPADSGATPDFSHLGRTRDVVTLIWTGRWLRKAGKVESAIRAYRSAMEIASRTSVEDLEPPPFDEDRMVRRYALPRESLIGLAARSMAEDGEWSREQWAEALPPSAASSLVASRVLARMQKRADADRLADLAIRQAESAPPPGFDLAEERAAGAEALAYRGRWTDAAEQYRRAIDLVEDDATRRMWWLNLAEVAQRAGDDTTRDRAIEAAKAPDSADAITRKALAYEQALPLVSSNPRRRP